MNAGGELAAPAPAANVAGGADDPPPLAAATVEEDGDGGGRVSPLSAACAFSRISFAASEAPAAPSLGDLPGATAAAVAAAAAAGGPNPPPPLPPPSEKSMGFPVDGSTISRAALLLGGAAGPPRGEGGTPTVPLGPPALPGAAGAAGVAPPPPPPAAEPRGPTGLGGGGTPARPGTWPGIPWGGKTTQVRG